MKIIDTHQHFWNYDPKRHDWINEDMQAIQKDFLPEQLAILLKENQVAGCISVQVDQTYCSGRSCRIHDATKIHSRLTKTSSTSLYL